MKFFCLSVDGSDSDLDWKDFFQRKFKETVTVFLSTGAENLASDYRLCKHPMMQPFLPLKTVVVEFSHPGYAFEAYLLLNENGISHEKSDNLQLWGLFEADEEMKAIVLEKKEQ